MDMSRNNLDKAMSPYLQQHKGNPIHWQEWSTQVRDYAQAHGKILFFSIGYATCHWCHVMAHEAFEDKEIADYLNAHFINVKVDREQRPDIDQYLMAYAYQIHGGGGWPLNVFLTPDLKPFFAVTYVGTKAESGIPALIDLLGNIKKHYDQNKDKITDYVAPTPEATVIRQMDLIAQLATQYDQVYGGFGTGQKFPPHSTLLFLMHYYENSNDPGALQVIEKTLDSMATRGLHDHLQGGFFRYCIDRSWTIPHFEKMLYDQAMMLWVYSVGYKLLKKSAYKTIAEKIITCLNDTFQKGDLYISAYDADTQGVEGKTYLWGKKEVQQELSADEFTMFTDLYDISDEGNFNGNNHLVKKNVTFLPESEQKLLALRKKRLQPSSDQKIITSWNSLLGIAYVQAYRFLGLDHALEQATQLFDALLKNHQPKDVLFHSSINGMAQKQSFLEDYGSTLVFATYLYEETGQYKNEMEKLYDKTKSFYDSGLWYETRDGDFKPLPAQLFDHPAPSSVSLAEYGVLRADILSGKDYTPGHYKQPAGYDFYNLVTFIKDGHFHIIQSSEKVTWDQLPLNSIQRKGEKLQDCFERSCQEFDSVDELIAYL